MAKKVDQKEVTTNEELFWANMYQLDTVPQLLIERGIFTEEEFFVKLKQVQAEWESKKSLKQ